MNLPNSLTLTRIFLVPLLVVVLLTKFEGRLILGVPKEIVGAAIFGLASLTDWLDGYLARRRKEVTPLGQVIDPLADKLLTCAAFISLVQMELAPAWMVVIIISREFAVTGLRSLASTGSHQTIEGTKISTRSVPPAITACVMPMRMGGPSIQELMATQSSTTVAVSATAVAYPRQPGVPRFATLVPPLFASEGSPLACGGKGRNTGRVLDSF